MATFIIIPLTLFLICAVIISFWRLERSRRRHLKLPAGLEVVAGPNGPVFQGTADALFPGLDNWLRLLATEPLGTRLKAGKFTFCSSDEVPFPKNPLVVVLPPEAWDFVASKFSEVATGWEESPFYFSQCGYLRPAPEPDIGVKLLGKPLEGR